MRKSVVVKGQHAPVLKTSDHEITINKVSVHICVPDCYIIYIIYNNTRIGY